MLGQIGRRLPLAFSNSGSPAVVCFDHSKGHQKKETFQSHPNVLPPRATLRCPTIRPSANKLLAFWCTGSARAAPRSSSTSFPTGASSFFFFGESGKIDKNAHQSSNLNDHQSFNLFCDRMIPIVETNDATQPKKEISIRNGFPND